MKPQVQAAMGHSLARRAAHPGTGEARPDRPRLPLTDGELVDAVLDGDQAAFAEIMSRCNQPLYRLARAVVGDDAEAEDVLQEAYLRAYAALAGFRGEASLLTWLTSITLNEARGRLRARKTLVDVAQIERAQSAGQPAADGHGQADPETEAARAQARRRVERAIDELPAEFRTVFVLREVQELTGEETAARLGLKPQTVKTRLFRARRRLRKSLGDLQEAGVTEAFPFLGDRCRRLTGQVLERLPHPRDARPPGGPAVPAAGPARDRATAARGSLAGPGHAVGVTEALIYDVVHGFYARIRVDPALGPIFNRQIDDWDHHLAKMCDFWSSVLLMTGRFKGAPMATHAQLPDIRTTHFARWLHLFRQSTAELCPPPAAALFVSRAEIIAESLQLGIASARGERPEGPPPQ